MATEVAIAAEADTAEPDALVHQIRVAVPEGGYRHDLRAVSIVWRRELIRFRTDRLRAITALIQPILFLFVLGTGLSSLAGGSMPSGVSFKTLSIRVCWRCRCCSRRYSRPRQSCGTGSSDSSARSWWHRSAGLRS